MVCDGGEDGFLLCLLVWVVWFEEDISDSVLAGFWEKRAKFALCFALEEGMGDAGHDTSAITVPAVCTCSASVDHCTEKVAGIGNNFVRGFALDLAYEAYTARVSLQFRAIETLLGREGRGPRVWIASDGMGMGMVIECVDDDGGVATGGTVKSGGGEHRFRDTWGLGRGTRDEGRGGDEGDEGAKTITAGRLLLLRCGVQGRG